jgi:cyclophilin family peptidyl-prolyl cis-trans isomerase
VSRLAVLALLGLTTAGACATEKGQDDAPADATAASPIVVLETSLGPIVMELDPARAPETVANFLLHVRGRFYDGMTFHRILPGFVIQAGQVTPDFSKRTSSATAVMNEATNGLSNTRGTVAMARAGNPHSAIAEFYINLVNNASQLDFRDSTPRGFGYAVFGRVIEGMNVVDSIGRIRTRSYTDYPTFPVDPPVIQRAYLRAP